MKILLLALTAGGLFSLSCLSTSAATQAEMDAACAALWGTGYTYNSAVPACVKGKIIRRVSEKNKEK